MSCFMNKPSRPLLAVGVFCLFLPAVVRSQDSIGPVDRIKQGAPKVFIDCHQCDMEYIRTEITFVNFVRDRKEADVHVMITIQWTGSGGREYTVAFIGLGPYFDIQNTAKYVSNQTDTSDDQRKGLVRVLKVGLVPYAAKTPVGDFLDVNFERRTVAGPVSDKWNYWVFNVSMSGSLSGESTQDFSSLHGNVSANRVTPQSKLRLGVSARHSSSYYDIDGEEVSTYQDGRNFNGLYVFSLNDHWSVGSWLTMNMSTYNNIAFAVSPTPAVEYNYFPYSQSTRKQLRFLYRLGFDFNKYFKETIFGKEKESLLGQALSVTLEIKQPWGNVSASVQGSHYFHDLSLNRVEMWGWVNLHLLRGLSLSLSGEYSLVHDQISLPLEEASYEEILLGKTMLATSYEYKMYVGLSYTFGSIFSNIVNPRFNR